jgi:hypothetical protein
MAAAQRNASSNTEQTNWSHAEQSGRSHERLDAVAEACQQLLVEHLRRFQDAMAAGLWNVAIYVGAPNERDLRRVEGALRGVLTGPKTHLDPIRAVAAPASLVRDCMRHGRMIGLTPGTQGPAAVTPATILLLVG